MLAKVGFFALLALPLFLLVGCSDSSPVGDGPPGPGSILVVSGDTQEGRVALPLAEPIVVEVRDRQGRRLPRARVTWTILSGGGSVSPSQGTTDGNGNASAVWTLGSVAGEQLLGVEVTGLSPVQVHALGVPGPVWKLRQVDGDNQWGAEGESLPEALVIRAEDAHGNPLPGIEVSFRVTAGGGSILPEAGTTDDKGAVEAVWALGGETGTQTAAAEIDSTDSVVFTAILDSSLDAWILRRPRIAANIVWLELTGGARQFGSWSVEEREHLSSFYGLAEVGDFGLEDPAVNRVEAFLSDDSYPYTGLSIEDARSLYLSHVAQNVYLDKNDLLPWSLEDLTDRGLAIVLDSRSFYHLPQYDFEKQHGESLYFVNRRVLPAPPDTVLGFFESEGILRATPLETIEALLEWSRVNMAHYLYRFETGNAEWHWHYRGIPPASRIFEGTLRSNPGYPAFRSWTAGCHGTNHFYQTILRAVNIPVEYVTVTGHATPLFLSEEVYLSHGDDPYTALVRDTALFPARELLIDQTTWVSWFGPHLSFEDQRRNIGRRPVELALTHLPSYLLRKYCEDLDAGTAREEGKVFDIFDEVYTMSELESAGLWSRMDAKIAGFGECAQVPKGMPPPAS